MLRLNLVVFYPTFWTIISNHFVFLYFSNFYKMLVGEFHLLNIIYIQKRIILRIIIFIRYSDLHLFNQFGQQNLCHAFDAIIHTVIMEVYRKCEYREGIRNEIHIIRTSIQIHTGFPSTKRCNHDITCTDIRCLCSRFYGFTHFINQRKMNNFNLLRLFRLEFICKLISLKGYTDMHGIACRLEFIEFACRFTRFIALLYHKGNVIQKEIISGMFSRRGFIQGVHIRVIVIIFAIPRDLFYFKCCVIRYSSRIIEYNCDIYKIIFIRIFALFSNFDIFRFRLGFRVKNILRLRLSFRIKNVFHIRFSFRVKDILRICLGLRQICIFRLSFGLLCIGRLLPCHGFCVSRNCLIRFCLLCSRNRLSISLSLQIISFCFLRQDDARQSIICGRSIRLVFQIKHKILIAERNRQRLSCHGR